MLTVLMLILLIRDQLNRTKYKKESVTERKPTSQ